MNAGTALTDRDSELLQVLALRLRCLGVRQVAAYWWQGKVDAGRNARARLRQLEAAGLLHFAAVLARPLPQLETPVMSWAPGEPTPDFAPIAYHLKHRFARPVTSTPVVFATQLAASRFGGQPGRVPRRAEATHDLGLASVFLLILSETPENARSWVAESELVKGKSIAATKVPDALIRSRRGVETVIEFGGEYSKGKLAEFHEDCAMRGRRYQLW
jgi:hypothetical protein